MTFEEKKQLLHWLFDAKDQGGKPYGIYLSKRNKDKWDHFFYGKITGLRTMKDSDIDYQAWDEDEIDYKTNIGAFVGRTCIILSQRSSSAIRATQ